MFIGLVFGLLIGSGITTYVDKEIYDKPQVVQTTEIYDYSAK